LLALRESGRMQSGRFRFRALLNRVIHRLEVALSFLNYVFRQSANEQSSERLCLLKTRAHVSRFHCVAQYSL
jgi:hypothetical protein